MNSRRDEIVLKGQSAVQDYFNIAGVIYPSWSSTQKCSCLLWALSSILDDRSTAILEEFGVTQSNSFNAQSAEGSEFMTVTAFIHFEDSILHIADTIFSYLELQEWDCRTNIENIKKDRINRILDFYPALAFLKE